MPDHPDLAAHVAALVDDFLRRQPLGISAPAMQLPERRPDLLRASRHEASHAVVGALVHAGALVRVEIHEDGGGATVRKSLMASPTAAQVYAELVAEGSLPAPDPEAEARERVTVRNSAARMIIALLAGLALDARAGYADWRCGLADLQQLSEIAERVAGRKGAEDFLVPLRTIARLAVHDAAPLIDHLAAWLRRDMVIQGPAVDEWLAGDKLAVSLSSYFERPFRGPD